MSYCDTCIHHDVCGVEGVDDEAMTYCADRIEPCEEAVSRQAALDLCKRFDGSVPYSVLSNHDILPSVKPQEKTGHWIIKDGKEQGYDIGGVKTWYIQMMCNKCGFIKSAIEGHIGQYHFCPNCGAQMESEEQG